MKPEKKLDLHEDKKLQEELAKEVREIFGASVTPAFDRVPSYVDDALEDAWKLYHRISDFPIPACEVLAVNDKHCMARAAKILESLGMLSSLDLLKAITAVLIHERMRQAISYTYRNDLLDRADHVLDAAKSVPWIAFTTKEEAQAYFARLKDICESAKQEAVFRLTFLREVSRIQYTGFSGPVEKFKDRSDKKEDEYAFLIRVYGVHMSAGIRPADIRGADRGFYQRLAQRCSLDGRKMTDLFPRLPLDRALTHSCPMLFMPKRRGRKLKPKEKKAAKIGRIDFVRRKKDPESDRSDPEFD